jgi:uncharacterized membrane protein (UPF0127 family)
MASTITFPGTSIPAMFVDVARTPDELRNGLSNRTLLAPRTGMLFIFADVAVHSMWMPNMNFPLDIVWINEAKQIIKIETNVTPCSGNKNCKSYSSDIPIKYAIEMNAGYAAKIGLRVGLKVAF